MLIKNGYVLVNGLKVVIKLYC